MNEVPAIAVEDIPPPPGLSKVRFASWDGARIRADVHRRADSPHAIVLILPVGIASHPMAPLIERLGAWSSVYALYSRFVLDADVVLDAGRAIDASAHARDVVALTSHFGVERVGLVGYCTGALVAVRSGFLLQQRAAAIACCSGAFELSERTEYERDLVDLVAACAGQRRAARVVRRAVSAKQDARAEFHQHTSIPLRDDETFYKYATCLQEMYVEGMSGIAGVIDTPTLLVAGSDDQIVSPENSDVPRAHLSNSELRILAGEDHYLACRRNASAVGLIDDFLRSRLSGPGR